MTSIEWTDETWNPTVGCSRVSAGCEHCYAEGVAHRGLSPHHRGLTVLGKHGPRWTGEVRLVESALAKPLSWKKPRRVFVNSLSDLWHEGVSNETCAAIFGVMAACPHLTFQVLTKRPERMRAWFALDGIASRVDLFKHIALAGRIDEFFAAERVAPVEAWPGYFITTKGRVLSDWSNSGERTADVHELAALAEGQGHSRVMLYRDGETARPLIHRLVLATFDGGAIASADCDNLQGCHIDGDPRNNALWNLRWGTQASNWSDSKRHGTRRRYSKLTEDQVSELRALAADGASGAELGRRFSISDTQARNIASGRQWAPPHEAEWPLRSVWLGVSVEDQATADERIPLLLDTPAALRFVSCEPMLGPVAFAPEWLHTGRCAAIGPKPERFRCGLPAGHDGEDGHPHHALIPSGVPWFGQNALEWVIIGGESGPGARAFNVAWMKAAIEQCRAAGVPVFCKQLGANVHTRNDDNFTIEEDPPDPDFPGWPGHLVAEDRIEDSGESYQGAPVRVRLRDRKGGDMGEWRSDLRVREFPS